MPVNIRIHEQPVIRFLVEFSEFALLAILIFEVTDEQLNGSYRRTKLLQMYVFSIVDCP